MIESVQVDRPTVGILANSMSLAYEAFCRLGGGEIPNTLGESNITREAFDTRASLYLQKRLKELAANRA